MPNIGAEFPGIDRRHHPAPIRHPKSESAPIPHQFKTCWAPKSEAAPIRNQLGTKVQRSQMPNIGPECPEIDRRHRPAPIRHQNMNRRQLGINPAPIRTEVQRPRMPILGPEFPESDRRHRSAPIRHQNLNRHQFGINPAPIRHQRPEVADSHHRAGIS